MRLSAVSSCAAALDVLTKKTASAPAMTNPRARKALAPQRVQHSDIEPVSHATLALREQLHRITVAVHHQDPVVDSEAPVLRVPAPEDLHAAAHVGREEALPLRQPKDQGGRRTGCAA